MASDFFRGSLGWTVAEVELPIGCEGFTAYQILTNSECRDRCPGVSRWVLRSSDKRDTTRTAS